MSTKEFFTSSEELKQMMSAARATITAPFFANNVEEVKSVSEAYKLAKSSSVLLNLQECLYMNLKKSVCQRVQINCYLTTVPL